MDTPGFRYSSLEFPPYRHRPGVTPHPRRHPEGHLYGKPDILPEPFDPRLWGNSVDYLYGADLYNFAYYWEAHEAWEGIWKTTARTDRPGKYFQGLIQLSAALLKREQGSIRGMQRLAKAGLAKLNAVASAVPIYCGLDLRDYISRMEKILASPDLTRWPDDPRIRLKL